MVDQAEKAHQRPNSDLLADEMKLLTGISIPSLKDYASSLGQKAKPLTVVPPKRAPPSPITRHKRPGVVGSPKTGLDRHAFKLLILSFDSAETNQIIFARFLIVASNCLGHLYCRHGPAILNHAR